MEALDIILHLDSQLKNIISLLGPLSYVLLFAIIFAETGLVVAPFLPGDSLLFITGTLAAAGYLNIWVLYITLLLAAIFGDSVNYWIGQRVGPRVFSNENSRIFKKAYLEKTRAFYEKHGGKTIIIARFVPLIRTFAPFVAGVGKMKYRTFFFYNIIGAFVWVTSLTFAGYFFGALEIVENNFEIAIFGIIIVSLIPPFIEYLKHKREKNRERTSYSDIRETFESEKLSE